MGSGKKEAARKVRQGKTGDGMANVKTKGENFYRSAKKVKTLNMFKEGKAEHNAELGEKRAMSVARTLTAWSVTTKASIAAMTALWGVLAAVTSPRAAIAVAGALLLATPLLLRSRPTPRSRCNADLPKSSTRTSALHSGSPR